MSGNKPNQLQILERLRDGTLDIDAAVAMLGEESAGPTHTHFYQWGWVDSPVEAGGLHFADRQTLVFDPDGALPATGGARIQQLAEFGSAIQTNERLRRFIFAARLDAGRNPVEWLSQLFSFARHIARFIVKDSPPKPVLILVVLQENESSPEPGSIRAVAAGAAGLLRALREENPRIQFRVVTGSNIAEIPAAEQIGPEGPAPGKIAGANEIRYETGGARRVRELRALEPSPAAGDPLSRQATNGQSAEHGDASQGGLRHGGLYLITGGAGGLGRLFAKYLREQYAARVVLLGRSAPDPSAVHSQEFYYNQCDVTDRAALALALDAIKKQHGSIDGVLHAAGTIADEFLIRKNPEEVHRVLAPKITGAIHLDQLLADDALDSFILFSSVAGAAGNPGQSDYGAANAFLNEFALERNRLLDAGARSGRTLSIAWPLWEHDGDGAPGMTVAPEIAAEIREATGLAVLAREAGLRAFAQILDSSFSGCVVVAPGEREKIETYLRVSRPDYAAALREALGELVGVDVASIDLDLDWREYGLDQTMIARLVDGLNSRFGASLTPAHVQDAATGAELLSLFRRDLSPPADPSASHKSVRRSPERPETSDADSGNLPSAKVAARSLQQACETYLRTLLARELRLPPHRIEAAENFQKFGIDSLMVVRLNGILAREFGPISKTLFFEYSNLRDLASFFAKHHAARVQELTETAAQTTADAEAAPERQASFPAKSRAHSSMRGVRRKRLTADSVTERPARALEIAIIGMSGRYPGADDTEEFWRNLRAGRDCITEVPSERWSSGFFDADKDSPAKSYGRWGGFIKDADCFDPLFFNISPREAERLDPQERLFLQTVWHTLEDAGYAATEVAQSIAGDRRKNAGVYVGVMWGDYQLFGVQEAARGGLATARSSYWSIANRVSYSLNFNGPSMAVDTACSSSLTAIHLACESLARGETRFAIAGGVNLSLHPYKYIQLSRERFLASDGRCRSFGAGGDGYVPGEGVGAILLRPLAEARAAGDRILGVIKGTAINHGGTTNGFTVPNPNAQKDLILEALDRAQVDPTTLGYIEAHGTGTSLGDPIEIAGLSRAFQEYPGAIPGDASGIVPIGSVKSNIGHLESAAGIAGVMKVLLQMRAGQIAPSLTHSDALNPNIDFEATPFRVQTELGNWRRKSAVVPNSGDTRSAGNVSDSGGLEFAPRRAAVSSFGAGGSNGHVIIEEYIERDAGIPEENDAPPQIVPLSARSPEALRELAARLLDSLDARSDPEGQSEARRGAALTDIAHTLRVGREPLNERLALIAGSLDELREALREYLDGTGSNARIFSGRADSNADDQLAGPRLLDSPEDRGFIRSLAAAGEIGRIAAFWAAGATIHWSDVYEPGRRVALPGYPFARERYWLATSPTAPTAGSTPRLHPLLDANVSTLYEEKFVRALSAADFVIRDHRFHGRGIFPGAAYLEMARAAAELACESAPTGLQSITFEAPLFVSDDVSRPRTVEALLFADRGNRVEFEFRTREDGVHARGSIPDPAQADAPPTPEFIDLAAIAARTRETFEVEALYSLLSTAGLEYGETFQCIQEIHRDENQSELLARLRLPEVCERDGWVLHPALLDGAFQSTVALVPAGISFLPYSIAELSWNGTSPEQCLVHVVRTAGDESEQSFDITIAHESGEIWAALRGFSVRALSAPPAESADTEPHFFAPRWIAPSSAVPGVVDSRISGADRFEGDVLLLTNDDALAAAVSAGEARCRRLRLPETERLAAILGPELATDRVRRVVLGPELAAPALLLSLTHLLLERPEREGEDSAIGILILSDGRALARSCAGFARTLRLERPGFEISLFESPDAGRDLHFAQAMFATFTEVEVRLRDGQSTIRQIELIADIDPGDSVHSKLADRNLSAQARNTAALRTGGVYLITGGAGGLGLVFAEFLVREFDARVALVGRRPLTEELTGRLAALAPQDSDWTRRIAYFATDLTDRAACDVLSRDILNKFGELNGILHSAGVLRDSLLINKSRNDFEAVLAPKIQGTVNLDQAFAHTDLDFLALFSSVASVCGNRGQADYASGNAFLDAFAEERNELAARGERRGRAISLNWPLWSSGGMTMDADARALFERLTGLRALETEAGLRAFERALGSGLAQVIVAPGDRGRILDFLNSVSDAKDSETPRDMPGAGHNTTPAAAPANPGADAAEDGSLLEAELSAMVAALLKIDPARIRAEVSLSEYGVDSVALTRFASQLNHRFDLALNPSIFFEHTSIVQLARHLREGHGVRLESADTAGDQLTLRSTGVDGVAAVTASEAVSGHSTIGPERSNRRVSPASASLSLRAPGTPFARGAHRKRRFATESAVGEIAIVGLHCNFPGAADPEAFWENLVNRRDMIDEVPADRWDWREFAGDALERNRSVSRWGGFVADLDKFDPLFFGLSPHEAELMDPQQRILLETVWKTIEDAGYRASDLAERSVGLFVGVSTYDYMRRIASDHREIDGYFATGNTHSVVANRISYLLNLRGPSQAVDTACSSSLVALHNALRAIQSGDCEAAIVGGVNALTDPDLYISFSQAGMLSPDGRCKTFDREANGYVRGEGAGAVFLKPLERALEDDDQIYGVLRGSAVNHGGRAQSMTAPNPAAQAELLLAAYRGAQIPPDSVSYIETHGTGTALGDPIEINGLKQAFAQLSGEYGSTEVRADSCALGSVKTNIGHLEAAAGMAGLIKVLLMFRHRSIPGNVNFTELNPYIDFQATPFYVAAESRPWPESTEYPLRAGVSSFGFGGANAHIVLEEFVRSTDSRTKIPGGETVAGNSSPAVVVPLSARDASQLKPYAQALRDFVAAAPADGFALDRVACTLQTGREAFAERLAILADSRESLLTSLEDYLADRSSERIYAGSAQTSPAPGTANQSINLNPEGGAPEPEKIAADWVGGAPTNWDALYGAAKPIRMSLPTYPFRRERYWIGAKPTISHATGAASLHPLLHANVSTLDQQKFVREIKADEFLIRDHRLEGRGLLPGTAYLEMARAAAGLACESDNIALRDIVWEAPLFVGERPLTLETFIYPGETGDACEFEIESAEYGVHARGIAMTGPEAEPSTVDLAAIRGRLTKPMSPEGLYERLAGRGLEYGPAFRRVTGVRVGDQEALVEITGSKDPTDAEPGNASDEYILHPALLDAAVHATACLFPEDDRLERSFVPAALAALRIAGRIPAECLAWIRRRSPETADYDELIFDLQLLSPEDGAVCAELHGLRLQARATDLAKTEPANRDGRIHFFQSRFASMAQPDISRPAAANDSFAGDLLVYDAAGVLSAADLSSLSHADATLKNAERPQVVQSLSDLGAMLGSGNFERILYFDRSRNADAARELLEFFRFARAVARGVGDRAAFVAYCRAEGGPSEGDAIPQLDTARLTAAAAAGLLRALHEENPRIGFRVITGASLLSSPGREFLRGEIARGAHASGEDGNQEIRYEGGQRQAREIQALEITDAPAIEGEQNSQRRPETQAALRDFEPALREGGVYLITGGTGGLGRLFAGFLTGEYGARVIVLGRSTPGDAETDRAGEFIQCDVSDEASLESAVREIKAKYGVIHGVLHAAGCIADEFVIRKSDEDVRRVLAPKVTGVLNLDRLLADEPLDLFVLFSSIAGAAGNAGQSDYGAANAYLNEFAVERNRLREYGLRSGRTLSIAWPLWDSKQGITVAPEIAAEIFESTGLSMLAPQDGLRAFTRILEQGATGCVIVAPGDRQKIAALLGVAAPQSSTQTQTPKQTTLPPASSTFANGRQLPASTPGSAKSNGTAGGETRPAGDSEGLLRARAEGYFQELLAREVKLPVERLGVDEAFQKFGIDSVMIVRLNRLLARDFGSIPKTLFFEYGDLRALTGYFIEHHAEALAKLTDAHADGGVGGSKSASGISPALEAHEFRETRPEALPGMRGASRDRGRRGSRQRSVAPGSRYPNTAGSTGPLDIAIIGMSGRYPGADDLEEFWRNLRAGRDCIVEVPEDRWGAEFFDADKDSPAKSYGRWGGFIKDADCFDPLFFNISPREAERMDPQERLFLQTAWNTLEDAGYIAAGLSADSEAAPGDDRANAGVFVGVMWGEYQLFGAGAAARGDAETAQSNYWSIANRVSYVMDLHGPSMAVDTACSSSLTAIHLACESLARGESRFAIAGGVNLSLHPYKFIQLSRGRFLASDGRCRSFGEGGDGYVPGEGVGAVLLRPLAEAEAAGDRILGVIKGTAINHGGATNGFTVPNPVAQGDLILKALQRAEVDPRSLNYIEAHGTGTSLGDPIEIAGLSRAFRQYRKKFGLALQNEPEDTRPIPIGSVKSNIGHLESAAGIAGITKVLLQLQAGELAPSLMHSEALNPNIDFEQTPFRVQRELADWHSLDHQDGFPNAPAPRRAAISSFGAGGSNAHVIIEEYVDRRGDPYEAIITGTQIVPLSARTPDRLQALAARLLRYLEPPDGDASARTRSAEHTRLPAIAHTLRAGRTALDERLAFVVRDTDQLREALRSYTRGESGPGMFQASVAPGSEAGAQGLRLADTLADREFLQRLHAEGQQHRIAALWTAGTAVDWKLLYGGGRVVSLPTYPFTRERYWIQNQAAAGIVAPTPVPLQSNITAGGAVAQPVVDQSCLVREWRERALPPQTYEKRKLLVLVGERHSRALRGALGRIGQQDAVIFRAGTGVGGRRSNHEFDVDLRDTQSVRRSLAALRETAGDGFPDTIVDLLDIFESDSNAGEKAGPVAGRVALYQAFLEDQPENGLALLHLTRRTQSFQNEDPQMNGALWNGFMRVFGAEYGRVRARTIDLGRDDFVTLPELIALAGRESAGESGEICYRNGRCYEPYFREQPLLDSVRIATDGVYVISGGTRGLGAAFARRLVARGARHLVLMGREDLPDREDWRRLLNASEAPSGTEAQLPEATLGKIRLLVELQDAGAQIRLYSGSLGDYSALKALFRTVRRQWGAIRGVLHCAGLVSDENPAFIHKNSKEIDRVLEPKTTGTRTLARALSGDRPDFFALFSSVSASIPALGVGLSDYSAANSYLDFFAARQHAKGRRYFKSINWPSWTDAGFGEVASDRYRRTGLLGLSTEAGLALFEKTVQLGAPVIAPVLVDRSIFQVEGLTDARRRNIPPSVNPPASTTRTAGITSTASSATANRLEAAASTFATPGAAAGTGDSFSTPGKKVADAFVAKESDGQRRSGGAGNEAAVKSKLKELLSKELRLPTERFEDDRNFGDYGVDSVLLAAVVRKIERWLGRPFDPSSMLEHPTLARLSSFIARNYAADASEPASSAAPPVPEPPPARLQPAIAPILSTRDRGDADRRIAVIGMACNMPGANDVNEYWRNLSEGRASIVEVPPERWDVNEFYSPDGGPGKSISKWGGFIQGAGRFDAGYFGIDEALAMQMDPLQRLSLESGLLAMLDAGYEARELAGRKVGVYMGSRSSLYVNRIVQPDRNTVIGVGQNFIAARMSDYFNFTGNNLVVDTACSSSLVSLHLACRALNSGEEELALVGGVDLLLDEMSYLSLSAAQALSPDGKCHTFDVNANGFVPGEGCGMVLLKPLDRAMQDGDRVYAVIRGSAINNDGRTMGITTPNVDAQISVIEEALERAGVGPETISCLETHGTGTMIGDPIELKALTNVFRKHTNAREFCAVGSVKTNIGHLLSAAGIASAIKIALAIHHKQLPPTLNCETPNPRFAFAESPFFPNTALRDWQSEIRRAGISSFGFGGTNCHLIMEELQAGDYMPRRSPLPAPEFKKKSYWLPKRPIAVEPATNGHHAESSILRPLMALERV